MRLRAEDGGSQSRFWLWFLAYSSSHLNDFLRNARKVDVAGRQAMPIFKHFKTVIDGCYLNRFLAGCWISVGPYIDGDKSREWRGLWIAHAASLLQFGHGNPRLASVMESTLIHPVVWLHFPHWKIAM